jgi:CelD/BcsL family acetyltransferase involved in cellulose biosynthesis
MMMSDQAIEALDAVEFEPFKELESRRRLWSELATRSGNVFATWEWADVWWRHFAAGETPAFVECRLDSRPFAILPLYVARRGPLRFLRLIGHGPGDVLGPVCAPADAELAGLALGRVARELDLPPLLLAERLPSGAVAEGVGGRLLQREANPRLDIDGATWDEYLATRSRNLREKVRRSARKLKRSHEVAYRLCEGPERLDLAFDTLLRLHKDRWGGEGAFERESVVSFHRELTAVMLERDWLRLWTMEIDGEPAAAWYGYRFGATESFYQSGRDRRFDSHSAGFLMLAHTIEAAFADGLERYAFLRGNEPYKDRFATADDGLETRALGSRAFTRLGIAVGAAALRSPRLRRLAAVAIR